MELHPNLLQRSHFKDLTKEYIRNEASPWRSRFHIQAMTGLLNDPNGIAYFNGQYHIFYQWYPFAAIHGTNHWYHVTSEDMVHFENAGVALRPDEILDDAGCFSGTALVEGNMLYLVYSGIHQNAWKEKFSQQVLAAIDEKGHISKYKKPLFPMNENYTFHQRDPKIWKEKDQYYILLGAQEKETKKGKFLLYTSKSLLTDWEEVGPLQFEGEEDYFMVECPSITKIQGKDVLFACLQGKKDSQNAHSTYYRVGQLDLKKAIFTAETEWELVDYGFDFYAPQVFGEDPRLLAWLGVPNQRYPALEKEGFVGQLSLSRTLDLKNNQLIQKPEKALESLRQEKIFEVEDGQILLDKMHGQMPKLLEIQFENPNEKSFELHLWAKNGYPGLQIQYDQYQHKFTLSRNRLSNPLNSEYGFERSVATVVRSMAIYGDQSSIEIFLNEGEISLSAIVLPNPNEHMIRFSGSDVSIEVYSLMPSVSEKVVF